MIADVSQKYQRNEVIYTLSRNKELGQFFPSKQ